MKQSVNKISLLSTLSCALLMTILLSNRSAYGLRYNVSNG